jgi:hypothetical protein
VFNWYIEVYNLAGARTAYLQTYYGAPRPSGDLYGIAVDGAGSLYTLFYNRNTSRTELWKFNAAMALLASYTTTIGSIFNCCGLCYYDNSLYATYVATPWPVGSDLIRRLTMTGATIDTFGVRGPGVDQLSNNVAGVFPRCRACLGDAGKLYVMDRSSTIVREIATDVDGLFGFQHVAYTADSGLDHALSPLGSALEAADTIVATGEKPGIKVLADGRIRAVYQVGSGAVQTRYSSDMGATWSTS